MILKWYRTQLRRSFLMIFGRNIQKTRIEFACFSFHLGLLVMTLLSLKLHRNKWVWDPSKL